MVFNSLRKDSLYYAFVFSSVAFFTYFVSPYYLYGDQIIYRDVYEYSGKSSLIDSFFYYKSRVLTSEVGHFFIIWLASGFFEKDAFVALSNAFLALFSAMFLRRLGANYFIIFLVVVLGYYFWAMYLSAERLKFSFIFLVAGFIAFYNKRLFLCFFLFVLAAITHVQSVLAMAALAIFYFYPTLKGVFVNFKLKKIFALYLLFVFVFFVFLLFFFKAHIFGKIISYNVSFGIEEYFRISVFLVLSLIYSKGRYGVVVLIFLFWFFLVFLVGGMRINFFGYFTFVAFAVQYKRGNNFGMFITSGYFVFGAFFYIVNTFICGANSC